MKLPLRVLHLEDDPNDVELVQSTLVEEGIACDVVRVETRADFLAAVEQGGFDLIFADYTLPSFDGMAALAIAREKCPDVPFIIVSGTLGEERAIESLKSGATDYVLKERMSRLAPSVRRAIEEAEERIERKQAEKELQESEKMFKGLLESAPDAIVIVDSDGKIMIVNATTEELFGYDRKELVGENVEVLMPERFRSGHQELRLDFLGHPHARRMGGGLELWALRKDGTEFPVEISLGPFETVGKILVSCAIRDITDRKRLEEQFLQAQKMEVVGRLAGGVAHDFNNLLTGISGYSQLLLQNVEPDSDMGQDLLEIHALGDRAAGLTRQLLAFSRKQTLELAVFNLNETIEDASKMLKRFIGEDIDLKFLGSADLGTVKADPAQIEQVLMNLAINARDAMPSGGRLTIETANIDLDQEYADKHLEVEPGPYVMLAVTDDGHGMDRETLDRIFEPFFTTKDKEKGTGLGLATVYGIVRQHNGHTWVYSEPGKGTTFKIYLPRVDEPAQELPAKAEGEVLPEGSETILVAEDERTVRDVVERILEGLGYKIFAADGPEKAEGVFAERWREIDLLLTDVIMPGCSGPELYEKLAAKRPSLKVLYISGYTDAAVLRNHVLDAGVSFIQKPFSPRSLAQKVREVLEGGKTEGEE